MIRPKSIFTSDYVHHISDRPIRLTQCCTQFKAPGVKILCVLYLPYNVAFTFKCMEIPEKKKFSIPKGFELGTTLSGLRQVDTTIYHVTKDYAISAIVKELKMKVTFY